MPLSSLGPALVFLTVGAIWKVATKLTATEIAWTLGVLTALAVLAVSIVFNIWPVLLLAGNASMFGGLCLLHSAIVD
jgi:chromate transport protein ChrA